PSSGVDRLVRVPPPAVRLSASVSRVGCAVLLVAPFSERMMAKRMMKVSPTSRPIFVSLVIVNAPPCARRRFYSEVRGCSSDRRAFGDSQFGGPAPRILRALGLIGNYRFFRQNSIATRRRLLAKTVLHDPVLAAVKADHADASPRRQT